MKYGFSVAIIAWGNVGGALLDGTLLREVELFDVAHFFPKPALGLCAVKRFGQRTFFAKQFSLSCSVAFLDVTVSNCLSKKCLIDEPRAIIQVERTKRT